MTTARELTREQRQRYIAASHERDARSAAPLDPALAHARQALLERIRQVAERLKTHYGARRVMLFGSLAHGAWFSANSDVDIAVEGLAGDTCWAAWAMIEQHLPERSVDLVELEAASASLRETIETDGILL
jgi:predicted nucleotidyltransferase